MPADDLPSPAVTRPAFPEARLTVVILTRDEAARLPRCLEAIPARYPVLVLDSGSTDETVATARRRGCAVAVHPWSGFAAQRNVALDQGGILSPWVLFVDADEIYPPRFFEWFEAEAEGLHGIDAVMVPSLLVLRGVTLRHAPGYPVCHPRLIRRGAARFVQADTGHGETVAAGTRILHIGIPYLHYFHDGDLAGWMAKHVALAAREAMAEGGAEGGHATGRARLRRLARRLPLRVPLRFLYHYVIRGGFLDGRAGLDYALMYTWYEATIALLRFTGTGGRG